MPEEMFTYLEGLSIRSKVTGGRKLPNTAIVRACVMSVMDLDLDVSGVQDEDELKERIAAAWAKHFGI